MTEAQSTFVKKIAIYVKKYASSYGILVHSPIIAQAILESGYGTTTLSKYYNYFGMKCGTKWTGASVNLETQEEYTVGTMTTITDNFRVYSSMKEGVKGYFEFIQLSRYSNLKGVTDPQTYLNLLISDGYATDSQYVTKCMNLITQNNLTKYDTETETGSDTVSTYDKYINSTGTHYISNSGSDENGAYKGGEAGDQTGLEWCLKNFYVRPWTCVLRYPDEEVGLAIAELGCAAALNDNIGYDQNQRDTYWTQLQAVGYDPSKITTACEADCSSGVIANVKAVGHLKNITALQNITATYTGNMKASFKNAGFTVLTDSKYLTDSSYLLPGDILLNESAHTATNITKGANADSSTTTTSTTSSSSSPSKTVQFTGKVTASSLNVRKGAGTSYGTCSFSPLSKGTEVDVCDTATATDGSSWYYICYNSKYGYASASYISKVSTATTSSTSTTSSSSSKVEDADSYDKSLKGTYTTTANLNLRTGAGTGKSIVTTIPKGDKVTCYGYYTAVSSTKWYLVTYSTYTGFVSSAYLK